ARTTFAYHRIAGLVRTGADGRGRADRLSVGFQERKVDPTGLVRTLMEGPVAEREGFEPSIRGCRIHTFQACAFDHSATAPHAAVARRPGKGAHLAGGARLYKRAACPAPDGRLPRRHDAPDRPRPVCG